MRRIRITLLALTFAAAAWASDISLPDAWDPAWRGESRGAIETYQKFARENPEADSRPTRPTGGWTAPAAGGSAR